ncbi:MAG: UDP-N-acetylglucosamine 1-carboxyvinyltransferase [Acidimicrobiia bacterium]|nr:UDP-N-acetylglucosamine 1-carboxyvinyltransferase [Acidimicrobiia bacterium]
MDPTGDTTAVAAGRQDTARGAPKGAAVPGAIRVRPGEPLAGELEIGGAKNSVLKLLAATTLAPGRFTLRRVPRIADVATMTELLASFGCRAWFSDRHVVQVEVPERLTPHASYELVSRMRASISVLGPLLARCGEATVALPGGDDFGARPIDMHLSALERLGVDVEVSHGYVQARAPRLKGGEVTLQWPSVGATENVMMAAVAADGRTVIENAAREPEIADLAAFLNRMGAEVLGAGSPTITINGGGPLAPVDHAPIPDRIETAVFLAAVGIAGGEVTLRGAQPGHLRMLCDKLGEMDLRTSTVKGGMWAMAPHRLRAAEIVTLPYPGIATDYQPLLVAMLSLAEGVGLVTENVFANRFRYVGELLRMGADIRVEGRCAIVRGRERLSGAPVRATDIRAGAALVVAGLGAAGETIVRGTHHISRGHDDLVGKLQSLGADVDWVPEG